MNFTLFRKKKSSNHRQSFAAKIRDSFQKPKNDDPWTKFIDHSYHYDKISTVITFTMI
jgi:hypothetical protein